MTKTSRASCQLSMRQQLQRQWGKEESDEENDDDQEEDDDDYEKEEADMTTRKRTIPTRARKRT